MMGGFLERRKSKFLDEFNINATFTLKKLQSVVTDTNEVVLFQSTIEYYLKDFHFSFKRIEKLYQHLKVSNREEH